MADGFHIFHTEAGLEAGRGRRKTPDTSKLVIVGGQAYTLAEWEAHQRRLAYEQNPERKARKNAAFKVWRERNREHWRAYKREWARRKRAA